MGVDMAVEGTGLCPAVTIVPGFVFCTVVQPPRTRAIMRINGEINLESEKFFVRVSIIHYLNRRMNGNES